MQALAIVSFDVDASGHYMFPPVTNANALSWVEYRFEYEPTALERLWPGDQIMRAKEWALSADEHAGLLRILEAPAPASARLDAAMRRAEQLFGIKAIL